MKVSDIYSEVILEPLCAGHRTTESIKEQHFSFLWFRPYKKNKSKSIRKLEISKETSDHWLSILYMEGWMNAWTDG